MKGPLFKANRKMIIRYFVSDRVGLLGLMPIKNGVHKTSDVLLNYHSKFTSYNKHIINAFGT